MSDSLLEGLAQQFDGDTIGKLAGLVGADEQATGKAIAVALPMLLGSIAGSANKGNSAESMFGAINRDHDGSILDMLGPLLSGGYASRATASDGTRILGHVLGGQQPAVEQTVAKQAGISQTLAAKLLPYLAPIIMGYVSRKILGGGGDAGVLGSALGNEQKNMRQQDSGLGGLLDILGGGGDDGGGIVDAAGDLLGSPVGKAILGQLLKR